MNAEETAQRFSAERPGFDLVSYGEVGLPYFRVRLRLQVLEHKVIGPIDEFVLRGIAAGLNELPVLEAALGLDEAVIEATLVDLVEADAVELLHPDSGEGAMRITARGTSLLSDAKLVEATERTVEVDFDGLLRIPVPTLPGPLEPRELVDRGLKEVPPYPAKRPDRDEMRLHAAAIEQIARQAGGPRQQLSDVLAVRSVERRLRIFQPAVALVYRPQGSRRSQGQVAFAIGGQLSDPHAQVFARAGLGRKLGIAKRGIEDAKVAAGRVLGADLVERIETAPITGTAEDRALEIPDNAVQWVETYEHPKLLRGALRECTSHLLVISPWLRAGVVDGEFLDLLDMALERDVEVYVGWGMSASEAASPDADPAARKELEDRVKRRKNLHFKRLGKTHAKVLICDDRFVVVTSFNWLSFQGDPKRTFRDERGTLVSIKEQVAEQFENLSKLF